MPMSWKPFGLPAPVNNTSYWVLARIGGSSSADVLRRVASLERAVAVQRTLNHGLARARAGRAGDADAAR
jgi:hypothetical protein